MTYYWKTGKYNYSWLYVRNDGVVFRFDNTTYGSELTTNQYLNQLKEGWYKDTVVVDHPENDPDFLVLLLKSTVNSTSKERTEVTT